MPERASHWRNQVEVMPSGFYKVWSVREVDVSGSPSLKVSWNEAADVTEANYSAEAAIDTFVNLLDGQKAEIDKKRNMALELRNI